MRHQALYFSIPFPSMTMSGSEVFRPSQGNAISCPDNLPGHWFDTVLEKECCHILDQHSWPHSSYPSAWTFLISPSKPWDHIAAQQTGRELLKHGCKQLETLALMEIVGNILAGWKKPHWSSGKQAAFLLTAPSICRIISMEQRN